MGLYIYGAGEIGKNTLCRLKDYGEECDGFVDTFKTGEYMNHKIYSMEEIDKQSTIIISVLNTNQILSIFRLLKENDFNNIYWYYDFTNVISGLTGLTAFLGRECLDMMGWGTLIMPHIELHIADNCNLNCKGCTHFAPLFKELGCDLEDRVGDVAKINSLFDEVFRLDILGGEPLLNPELKDYIIALRKELPNSFIQIYTNGILMPKLDKKVLEVMHENNIGVTISEYYPTHQMIDIIVEVLNDYSINYRLAKYDWKQNFNIPLSLSSDSKYPQKCISDGCFTVANGLIAKCPTLMYVEKFNTVFNQSLPTEGIYKIDDYKNGEDLLSDMNKVVPLCKHCIQCDTKWSVCGKEITVDDFAVMD